MKVVMWALLAVAVIGCGNKSTSTEKDWAQEVYKNQELDQNNSPIITHVERATTEAIQVLNSTLTELDNIAPNSKEDVLRDAEKAKEGFRKALQQLWNARYYARRDNYRTAVTEHYFEPLNAAITAINDAMNGSDAERRFEKNLALDWSATDRLRSLTPLLEGAAHATENLRKP